MLVAQSCWLYMTFRSLTVIIIQVRPVRPSASWATRSTLNAPAALSPLRRRQAQAGNIVEYVQVLFQPGGQVMRLVWPDLTQRDPLNLGDRRHGAQPGPGLRQRSFLDRARAITASRRRFHRASTRQPTRSPPSMTSSARARTGSSRRRCRHGGRRGDADRVAGDPFGRENPCGGLQWRDRAHC